MPARRASWADVPSMPRPDDHAEMAGLHAIVAIMLRMTTDERERTLQWLLSRFTPTVRLGDGPDE